MTSDNPNMPNQPQWPGQQPPPPPPYQPPNPYVQGPQPPRKGRRPALIAAVAAIVVVVVVVVGLLVSSRGDDVTAANPSPAASQTPVTVTADTIQVGRLDAPVVVGVYFDYMCPYCGQFERPNSAELQQDVQAGTIRLDLHPMSFLDQASSTQYSTRAASAAVTIARQAPGAFLAFHASLFEHQPAEGTVGLSDDELAQLATEAGVPAGVTSTFAAHNDQAWVTAATQAAFTSGVTGTPTVTINGQKFTGNLYQAGALTAAIAQGSSK